LCSIVKNAFLHTNTHRSFGLLAVRNILRSMFGLSVVYTSRWTHPLGKSSQDVILVHSTKVKLPLVCDIMCTLDTFLLALPMFIMIGLAIHMFTRAPSPHFNPFPASSEFEEIPGGIKRKVASLEIGLLPKEPLWLSILLPILPILSAGLVATPIPLLHLSHKLQALPEKFICMDTQTHLTFDLSLFILTLCLPLLLFVFLTIGLILRRCIYCSFRHCCNSWCKEEFVIVLLFLILTAVHCLMYLPMLRELMGKLNLPYIWMLDSALEYLPNYVTRGCEVASGIALPVLCYAFLPAYRKFCNEPDPDDLKLSKPKMQNSHTSDIADRNEAILTSVRKSVDSHLDFMEEMPESKRDYEDL